MRVQLLAFGKLKTPGLSESAGYYLKLLRSFVATDATELKPLPVPEKSTTLRRQIQEKEGALLNSKFENLLSPRDRIYLLDEGGKAMTTKQWAALVREWESGDIPQVALCVGSSLGFSEAMRKRAHGILSLGPQTLPHELARVVLTETLYRAWSVVRGHPYHNEGA
ncbi:23S rRNA (pseudouridine(1915)-N(3))-methyltransferase RlmH [Bdellovibrionota bacterium FG-2]